MIWPLGGLASVEVPNTWKANLYTVVAGPMVNVVICCVIGIALAFAGFIPNFNPISNPYVSDVYSYREGVTYTSDYGFRPYRAGTTEQIPRAEIEKYVKLDGEGSTTRYTFPPAMAERLTKAMNAERHVAPSWVVWLNRAFWISWVLLLLNLIPAYPLDGGQILMCIVWSRTSQRQGVTTAAYSGFGFGVLFLIVGITTNEVLFALLALFMLQMAYLKLNAPEVEDGPFGYDFSAGYTSLEKDDDPPPRKKRKQGYITRWWQARKMRKLQVEHEQRQRDEERMDQLLDKIARSGKESLTDEERRFLERASTRYRNRS
jgi:Zn-dependent protease